MKFESWSATTTKTTLKWCHQFGSITGLWTRNPTATVSIGMPGTAKNESDNIHGEMGRSVKARKISHIGTTWDRYVGRILDTRFESCSEAQIKTVTSMNLESFDITMDLYSHDMEMVVPISFDEYIQDKIGTNECNEIGSSGGDINSYHANCSGGIFTSKIPFSTPKRQFVPRNEYRPDFHEIFRMHSRNTQKIFCTPCICRT